MLTDKQKKIIQAVHDSQDKQMTKAQAVQMLKNEYYSNAGKYVGDILSRMVAAGLLQRVKNGVFKLGEGSQAKGEAVPENQAELF